MERHVRVAVIGAGLFAEQCHIPGIQAHPQAEVVALCARNRDRVTAMAACFGVADVHTDYRELLGREDIDAVTVAAPDVLHHEVAMAALHTGKHVFCEKPLAVSADEAQDMVQAAERMGCVNMVAFTFRYSRALMELRRLLRAGAIGTPFHVTMQVHWGALITPGSAIAWRERAAYSQGGVWTDGASHLFDALAYILGPVTEVCAQMMVVPREAGSLQPETVDIATCLARLRVPAGAGQPSAYADREQGTIHVSVLTSRVDQPEPWCDEIQVLGTGGAVRASLSRGAHERVGLMRAGQHVWEDVALPDDANTGQPLALPRMMGAFVDAVLRGAIDADQDPGFSAGLYTQLALDAGLRSARRGGWESV